MSEPIFVLFEITKLQWFQPPMTQTHFKSPFEFEPPQLATLLILY